MEITEGRSMSIWVHGRFLYNPITPIDPVKGNLKDILRTHELNHNKEPCKGRFRQGLQSRFRNRPARLPKGSFQIDPVFLSHAPPPPAPPTRPYLGGGVAGLNRVYLAAGWLHFCIQVVLVLSTTDHATTQVM